MKVYWGIFFVVILMFSGMIWSSLDMVNGRARYPKEVDLVRISDTVSTHAVMTITPSGEIYLEGKLIGQSDKLKQ